MNGNRPLIMSACGVVVFLALAMSAEAVDVGQQSHGNAKRVNGCDEIPAGQFLDEALGLARSLPDTDGLGEREELGDGYPQELRIGYPYSRLLPDIVVEFARVGCPEEGIKQLQNIRRPKILEIAKTNLAIELARQGRVEDARSLLEDVS